MISLLRTVEKAVYHTEDDCLSWRLCSLGKEPTWQPLRSIIGAGLAWSAGSDSAENLMAVAHGARQGDCSLVKLDACLS